MGKYKVYEYGQDWVVYDADADKEICVCSEFENQDESPEERAMAIANGLNLKGEIAGILVRLETGRQQDALEMTRLLVGDTDLHARAKQEYNEQFGEA